MATLTVVPAVKTERRSLLEVEEHLQALVDSTELVVAEQEQEFLADLESAMMTAKDKRDRVGQFISQCEGQAAIAKLEIERLRKRQTFFQVAVERMEMYVLRVVQHQSPDKAGRYPKLEGNTSTFAAQRNPPSVSITDEAAIPASCKTVSVTVPALMWERLIDSLDMDFAAELLEVVSRPQVSVVKSLVKESIAAEVPDWKERLKGAPSVYTEKLPGAAIAAGDWRLVRS